MELYTETLETKTGQRHYHVSVGGDEVKRYYGILDLGGPHYNIILDNLDDAVYTWFELIDGHIPGFAEPEEQAELTEDIFYLDMDSDEEEEYVGFYVDQDGWVIRLDGCWGCIPTGNN